MSPVRTLLLASLASSARPSRRGPPRPRRSRPRPRTAPRTSRSPAPRTARRRTTRTTSARPRSSAGPPRVRHARRRPSRQGRSPSASATRPTPRRRTYQIALCILYLDRYGDPGGPRDHSDARRAPPGRAELRRRLDLRVHPRRSPATERLLRTKLSDATLTAGKGPEAPKPGVQPSAARMRPASSSRPRAESSTPRWRSTRRGCSRPNTRARARSTTTTRTRSSACSARGCRASTASRSKAPLDLIEKRSSSSRATPAAGPTTAPVPARTAARR